MGISAMFTFKLDNTKTPHCRNRSSGNVGTHKKNTESENPVNTDIDIEECLYTFIQHIRVLKEI